MSVLTWINDLDGRQRAFNLATVRNGPHTPGTVELDVVRQPADKVGHLQSEGAPIVLTIQQAQSLSYSLAVAADEAEKTDYRRIENAKYALLGVMGDLAPLVAPAIGELQSFLQKIEDGEL